MSNALILKNLRHLSENGAHVEVRIPLVPDINTGEIDQIAGFLSALKGIRSVKLLPYHSFAQNKYDLVGKAFTAFRQPTEDEVAKAKSILRAAGLAIIE